MTQNLAAQYLIRPHSELRKGSRSGLDIGSADHDKQVGESSRLTFSRVGDATAATCADRIPEKCASKSGRIAGVAQTSKRPSDGFWDDVEADTYGRSHRRDDLVKVRESLSNRLGLSMLRPPDLV